MKVLNSEYKKEFKNSFGKSSAASEFFSVFDMAANYGMMKRGGQVAGVKKKE